MKPVAKQVMARMLGKNPPFASLNFYSEEPGKGVATLLGANAKLQQFTTLNQFICGKVQIQITMLPLTSEKIWITMEEHK